MRLSGGEPETFRRIYASNVLAGRASALVRADSRPSRLASRAVPGGSVRSPDNRSGRPLETPPSTEVPVQTPEVTPTPGETPDLGGTPRPDWTPRPTETPESEWGLGGR
jgi:hypothetical protein